MIRLASPPPPLPTGNLVDQLGALTERLQRFVATHHTSFDDLEAWSSVASRRGYRFVDQSCLEDAPNRAISVWLTGFRDGQILSRQVRALDEGSWRNALGEMTETSRGTAGRPPGVPSASFPEPVTFHPPFSDRLQRTGELRELAEAMLANIWHEAERTGHLDRVAGGAWYDTRLIALARRGGSLGSITGAFQTEVEFNGLFRDRLSQVLAPQSLLAIALWGARVWRELPHDVSDDKLNGRDRPVFLHPRALEKLIRAVGSEAFVPDGQGSVPIGFNIAGDAFTLTDDPHMEGLTTSRAFDDSGLPTRRLSLAVKGRITDRFARLGARGFFQSVCGNQWRSNAASPNGSDRLRSTFSSIYVGRGRSTYRELLNSGDDLLFVCDLEDVQHAGPPGRSTFTATLRSGVVIKDGRRRLLRPASHTLSGTLFASPGNENAFLTNARLSRELDDTGTGILPYALSRADVEAL